MENKYIKLTEEDYESLIQWLINLEDRIFELEKQQGAKEEGISRPTLAKTRIYEELPKTGESNAL